MFGANQLTTNRTGKLFEPWLDEENYITKYNYIDLVRTELKTRTPSNKRNNNLKQLQIKTV